MEKEVESAESKSKVIQPESDFAEFFIGIISKLYDLKCRQISNDVKSALIDMRRLRHQANATKKAFFSYKVPPVRCAYLYAYSVLHTVMVYSEFSHFLEQNKRFLLPVLSKDSLKICCIGGGPGTEAVAICRSINDFIHPSSAESDEPLLEVSVTVIDKLPHWKREESAVINAVNDESNVLHSKRIILHSDFMKADILKPFDKSLQEKIREADIVTIVKVGSCIQDKTSGDENLELLNMVRNVSDNMEKNSCLFMLDNAGGNVFYKMLNVLREMRGPSRLNRSVHKEYSLDPRTVKKLGDLMIYRKDSKYQPVLPAGKGKVSSCLLIKNTIRISENTQGSSSKEDEVKEMVSENSSFTMLKNVKENPVLENWDSVLNEESDVAGHFAACGNEQLQEKKENLEEK